MTMTKLELEAAIRAQCPPDILAAQFNEYALQRILSVFTLERISGPREWQTPRQSS